MAFEEIKAGLEKYTKELEAKLEDETQKQENKKVNYVLWAIAKQSPKRPNNVEFNHVYGAYEGNCAACGAFVTKFEYWNYCPHCGQAILWYRGE